MKITKLADITGKVLKSWYEDLEESQEGCCSFLYNSDAKHNYFVCMGFVPDGKDEWKIATKIGWQEFNNCMQTDFDINFCIPYDEDTGIVDDTCSVLDPIPKTMREWNSLASGLKFEARRVFKEWKVEANDDD